MKHFFSLLFALMAHTLLAQSHTFIIQSEWRMSQADSQSWAPAHVPGCVHTDLQRAGVIEDPLIGINEAKYKWIAEKDWVYESAPFDVDPALFSHEHLILEFGGLDTYADIFLNDTYLGRTENAFIPHSFDVKKYLKKEGNRLRIGFHSPLKMGKQKLAQLPYPLPGDGMRAVTRKPQYHYGWDWGPQLTTSGITQPIAVIGYSDIYVEEVRMDTYAVIDSTAEIQTTCYVRSDVAGLATVLVENTTDHTETRHEVMLKKGFNAFIVYTKVNEPRVWWCNDQGAQPLYDFQITVSLEKNKSNTLHKRTGIRTIHLNTEPDHKGAAFTFELNGRKVFMKGANYIPIAYFPATATEEYYRTLLKKCKDAHFNMLRVWGGGYYENDIFYDLCDEYGILVWQDFMFACSMYPGSAEFVSNVEREAEYQIRRLTSHPCLALWCGNNENMEGWIHWGWQAGLTPIQKSDLNDAYALVFIDLLSKKTSETYIPYWHSSPLYGRGNPASMTTGDSHYWGLWHDAEPFISLQQKIPRFMSEFGMQAAPDFETVKQMTYPDPPAYNHPGFLQHQKHSRGFALMDNYINQWYPPFPKDSIQDYLQLTQAMQAEGMCIGIEAQRRAMPYCMGTLYWQLNDVWPSFSWSSLDIHFNEKLFFHMVKDAYSPTLISPYVDHGELKLTWLNDNNSAPFQGSLKLEVFNAEGKSVKVVEVNDLAFGIGSQELWNISLNKLLGSNDATNFYCEVTVLDLNATIRHQRQFKIVPNSNKYLVPKYKNGKVIYERLNP